VLFHRGTRISVRRTVLLLGDVGWISLAAFLAAVVRLTPHVAIEYCEANAPLLAGGLAIFLVVFYASGMYERHAVSRALASIRLSVVAVLISVALIIITFYWRFQPFIGRGVLATWALFVLAGAWGLRRAYGWAAGSGLLSKKALLVGEGRDAADVIHLINTTVDPGLKILGLVSTTKVSAGNFIEGVPVLGTVDKLKDFVNAMEAETILVATSAGRHNSVLRMLRPLRCAGIEVIDFVSLHEMLAQEIPLDHINEEWLMNAAMNSSVIHIRKVKRIMDLLVAVAGLALTLPVSALAALAVRLDSRGPVLYRQRRSGMDGGVYTLMKFRTMRHDAEATSGAVWAGRLDARITRVGRFLRKWRIDEIPQLVNVLRGEMSLVGPRPERPEFVDTLAAAIPSYKERLMVPPGITGWAQVKYPYAASVEAARRKLQYDLYYIKHMSLGLDLLILLRTFKTILIGIRHSEAEEPAPSGAIDVLPLPAPHAKSGMKSA
jgi:exopolysaccharide biosynthesis polyprenyl glycosylphosphotransferase